MAMIDNPNYITGRYESYEDFRLANQQALENHGGFGNKYRGTEDQQALRAGAIQAFRAGDHEKIQRSLFNPEAFAIRSGRVRKFRLNADKDRYNILEGLIKGSADPAADIRLALKKFEPKESGRRLPPIRIGQTREDVLNQVLDCAVWKASPNVKLIAALLDAGADANAFGGLILAKAACPLSTDAVVELLCAHKASFEDAARATKNNSDWSMARKSRVILALAQYSVKYPAKSAEEIAEDAAAKIVRLKRELAEAQEEIIGTSAGKTAAEYAQTAQAAEGSQEDQQIAALVQAETARRSGTRISSSPLLRHI